MTYPFQEVPDAGPQLRPHAHVVEAVQLLLAVPLPCPSTPVMHGGVLQELQGGGWRGAARTGEWLGGQDVEQLGFILGGDVGELHSGYNAQRYGGAKTRRGGQRGGKEVL